MSLTALGLIVLAGLIHACWNIAAKKAGGDARFAFFSAFLMMLFWAPLGWWLGRDEVPRWGATEWGFVVASGVLHVFYYVILLRGYRKSDLTVVYPMARGSGPLLSSLVAIVLLGERISALGVAGIAGVDTRRLTRHLRDHGALPGAFGSQSWRDDYGAFLAAIALWLVPGVSLFA